MNKIRTQSAEGGSRPAAKYVASSDKLHFPAQEAEIANFTAYFHNRGAQLALPRTTSGMVTRLAVAPLACRHDNRTPRRPSVFRQA